MMLVLTKSDLQEMCDNAVTYEMIKQAKEEQGLQGHCQTSSKEWNDFNVHKAFVRSICTGYFAKYETKLGEWEGNKHINSFYDLFQSDQKKKNLAQIT